MSGYLSKRMKMMRGITSSMPVNADSDDEDSVCGKSKKKALQKAERKTLPFFSNIREESSSDEDSQMEDLAPTKVVSNKTSFTGGGRAMDFLNDMSDDDDDYPCAVAKEPPAKIVAEIGGKRKGRRPSVSSSSNSSVIALPRGKRKTALRKVIAEEDEDDDAAITSSANGELKASAYAAAPTALLDILNSSRHSDLVVEESDACTPNVQPLDTVPAGDVSMLNISDLLGPMPNSQEEKQGLF